MRTKGDGGGEGFGLVAFGGNGDLVGAYKFENGKARVKLKGRTFYIDRNGREVK